MKIVAKTDKGTVRDSNQDAYAVGEFSDEVVWAVVCDGMGGAAGGNIASARAVKVISDKINASYRDKMRDASIKNMLDSALTAANIEVYDLADARPELQGMGTTVVCAIVRENQAYIAHAGDSRAYILNKNNIKQ
ncbi:MAG: protein phosphatase 2C domain-containing protein, partial [Eubacterium sp.]